MADPNRELFESVINLLAPVLDELVFVGGCTTGIFITDPAAAGIRPTKAWMKATRRGRSTQVDRIRWAFKEFLDDKLSDITTGRVERWRALRTTQRYPSARRKKSLSPVTVNQDTRALRAALSRAREWDLVSANPIGKIKSATVDHTGVVRFLTPDEEQRLRQAVQDRDEARRVARASANAWRQARGHDPWPEYGTYTDYVTPLVLLALNTGLRRGELLQLQWRDLDLARKILTVRGEGAKTGQTRHVPSAHPGNERRGILTTQSGRSGATTIQNR